MECTLSCEINGKSVSNSQFQGFINPFQLNVKLSLTKGKDDEER